MTLLAVSSVAVTVSSLAVGASLTASTVMLIVPVRVCLLLATSYVVDVVPFQFAAGVKT